MNGYSRALIAAASVTIFGGCASSMVEPIKRDIGARETEVRGYVEQVQAGAPAVALPPSGVSVIDDLYVPLRKAPVEEARVLNDELKRQVSFNRTFGSIYDVAERLGSIAGLRVSVDPDVAAATQSSGVASPSAAAPLPAAPMSAGPLPPPGAFPGSPWVGGAPTSGPVSPIQLSYTGSLAGFLDVVAARYGISWEWDNGGVRFFRRTTRVFRLSALPGETSLDAQVGTTSGAGGASGASTGTQATVVGTQATASQQKSTVAFDKLSVWKGLEDSIKAMLTPGGSVVVSPATGTAAVTDTPQNLKLIERFVLKQNEALSRQVLINVRVFSVELKDDDSYGVNWNAVYTSVSQRWGLKLASNVQPLQGAGTLTLTRPLAEGETPTGWKGSEAILSALSEQGRVSQLTSASVLTINNQPVPLQVGQQTSYLAATSVSQMANAGTTTSLTPGTVTTGFSMNLVPHILDDSRLMLQYAIDISSLLGIRTVSSGEQTIQTPDLQTRNSMQRVIVRSGETLIVAGFDDAVLNTNLQGIGNAENVALGGAVGGRRTRTTLVVLLQPILLR